MAGVVNNGHIPSSFRDPSGFVFEHEREIYRQINRSYGASFERLFTSGLYKSLTESGLLVGHEEASVVSEHPDEAYKVIKPERIAFISYPYEWSFSQLKSAALATLRIESMALEHGMSLKDASAYNIQFRDSSPVHIDTLSFEPYSEGEPWVAYRQFCQHFLAPLGLMSKRDVRLNLLMRDLIDGIPLDLASTLLPWKTRLQFGMAAHIHMHAKSQAVHADQGGRAEGGAVKRASSRKLSLQGLRGILENLAATISKLDWRPEGTEWGEYYGDTNYSERAMDSKRGIVSRLIERVRPGCVWDLGANTGMFSRIASGQGALTIALDGDAAAVDKNFRECVSKKERNLLPLVMDLTNPSPSLGWDGRERSSLFERGPADLVMALAVVHHLAIGNNVPLSTLASTFSRMGRALIVEFVPKSDSQVRRLLASRADVFPNYDAEHFEREFSPHFTIEESHRVEDSERTLYLMRGRS